MPPSPLRNNPSSKLFRKMPFRLCSPPLRIKLETEASLAYPSISEISPALAFRVRVGVPPTGWGRTATPTVHTSLILLAPFPTELVRHYLITHELRFFLSLYLIAIYLAIIQMTMPPSYNQFQRSLSDDPIKNYFLNYAIWGGVTSILVIIIILIFSFGCRTKREESADDSDGSPATRRRSGTGAEDATCDRDLDKSQSPWSVES